MFKKWGRKNAAPPAPEPAVEAPIEPSTANLSRAESMRSGVSRPSQRSNASQRPSPNAQSLVPKKKFKSARLIGEYEKPWTEIPIKRRKWDYYIFWGAVAIGTILGILFWYQAYVGVVNQQYCMVFQDDFKTIDPAIWTHEVQRDGYGTGSFEWTTADPKNSFVDAEGLHIVPTITTESTSITDAQMLDGYLLNLTETNDCTGDNGTMPDGRQPCFIQSNATTGAIINPVRSARLSTKGKKTMKYGRIEVTAKMPVGDWLWPAIWMMPEKSAYGIWPASGEIDIAESKGNNGDNYPDGSDSMGSSLHWGPISEVDAFWRTHGKHNLRRTDYTKNFHVYGLEWSKNYLFTYIDNRLLQTFYIDFKSGYKNMWERGQFGSQIVNKSALYDPWSQTGQANTPFDQDFYLILNVAVGATNGYFADSANNKPWGDQSFTAPLQFLKAKNIWKPTWGNGTTNGMTVKSVKMWSEGACGSGTKE